MNAKDRKGSMGGGVKAKGVSHATTSGSTAKSKNAHGGFGEGSCAKAKGASGTHRK